MHGSVLRFLMVGVCFANAVARDAIGWYLLSAKKRHWVHSFSFPGSTPVCGVFFLVHSNSFDVIPGAHLVNPKCPACGTGHLGLARGACRHHERASVIAKQTHTLIDSTENTVTLFFFAVFQDTEFS